MKNTIKVLGFIALAAVIGFSMAACGDDEGNDADPFNGTWKIEEEGMWFVAADGKWTQYSYVWEKPDGGGESTVSGEIAGLRGTYTISGNAVSIITTDVNMYNEAKGTYQWKSYASLTDEEKDEYPPAFQGTVSGNTFTLSLGNESMVFTKQ
jgi:hypothetical protein